MNEQTGQQKDLRYLQLLSRQYPNVQAASSEIINLQAILNLPKGTEHFMSDLHGEYEAFLHIMNNASGAVREKVDILFQNMVTSEERAQLATLIYYPEEKLEEIASQVEDINEWHKITLNRLIEICRLASSKYTRSKVRKALPKEYAYIIDITKKNITKTSSRRSLPPTRPKILSSTCAGSSKSWWWTICTSSVISSTAARARTLSWIR